MREKVAQLLKGIDRYESWPLTFNSQNNSKLVTAEISVGRR